MMVRISIQDVLASLAASSRPEVITAYVTVSF